MLPIAAGPPPAHARRWYVPTTNQTPGKEPRSGTRRAPSLPAGKRRMHDVTRGPEWRLLGPPGACTRMQEVHASRGGQPRGHKKIQFRRGGTYRHAATEGPRSRSCPGLVPFREQALTEGVPPADRAQDDLAQKEPAVAQPAARPDGMSPSGLQHTPEPVRSLENTNSRSRGHTTSQGSWTAGPGRAPRPV